jgi:hypothetical protein
MIGKINRFQVDLRYAYRVDKRDLVGTNVNEGSTAIYGLRELAEKAVSRAVTRWSSNPGRDGKSRPRSAKRSEMPQPRPAG